MFQRIRQRFVHMRGWANGAAWFFIIVSLMHVIWVVQSKWAGPSGTTALYRTTVGTVSHDALGLTYSGWPGLGLALLQSAAIGAAAAATLLPLQRWRRIGHLVLISWAALWWFDLARLMTIDQQFSSVGQTLVMSVLLVATVTRAAFGWSSAPKVPRWPLTSEPRPEPVQSADAASSTPTADSGRARPVDPRVERAREVLNRTAQKVAPYAANGAKSVGRGLGKAGDAMIGWSERISSPERVQKGMHAVRRAVSASAGFASRHLATLAEVSRPPAIVPAPASPQPESTSVAA